jgi:hypothetical protein
MVWEEMNRGAPPISRASAVLVNNAVAGMVIDLVVNNEIPCRNNRRVAIWLP